VLQDDNRLWQESLAPLRRLVLRVHRAGIPGRDRPGDLGAEPHTTITRIGGTDALETEGLKVYISEGCVYCHTQQVRPLKMDAVWGRPSAPGDYAFVRPVGVWQPYASAILGSERTGPDLSNVGTRQASDAWQYLHLYNPRSVVESSIMPAFPWLFDVKSAAGPNEFVVPLPPEHAPATGVVVPNARGRALVAYLLSRRQVPIQGYGGTR
jgi:cytochrome c oxidase cbb3-type subunit 2